MSPCSCRYERYEANISENRVTLYQAESRCAHQKISILGGNHMYNIDPWSTTTRYRWTVSDGFAQRWSVWVTDEGGQPFIWFPTTAPAQTGLYLDPLEWEHNSTMLGVTVVGQAIQRFYANGLAAAMTTTVIRRVRLRGCAEGCWTDHVPQMGGRLLPRFRDPAYSMPWIRP